MRPHKVKWLCRFLNYACVVSGFWAPPALFTLVVLCITVFICIGYTCFGNFKYLSPHNYEVSVWFGMLLLSLSSSTLSLHVVYVLLQVKEEDEDTEKGVEENTMVLYLFPNKAHSVNTKTTC